MPVEETGKVTILSFPAVFCNFDYSFFALLELH